MNKIYNALINKRNDGIYNCNFNTEVGYFKSSTNAWKKLAGTIRNNEWLSGVHISSYKKFNDHIFNFQIGSSITFNDIIAEIENGEISSIRDFGGYEYTFSVTPIEIED